MLLLFLEMWRLYGVSFSNFADQNRNVKINIANVDRKKTEGPGTIVMFSSLFFAHFSNLFKTCVSSKLLKIIWNRIKKLWTLENRWEKKFKNSAPLEIKFCSFFSLLVVIAFSFLMCCQTKRGKKVNIIIYSLYFSWLFKFTFFFS